MYHISFPRDCDENKELLPALCNSPSASRIVRRRWNASRLGGGERGGGASPAACRGGIAKGIPVLGFVGLLVSRGRSPNSRNACQAKSAGRSPGRSRATSRRAAIRGTPLSASATSLVSLQGEWCRSSAASLSGSPTERSTRPAPAPRCSPSGRSGHLGRQ